jgi:hypothetical protein
LPTFFKSNRDTTGFIFRMLFAIDDRNKIIEIDPHFEMPEEWSGPHHQCLQTMYNKLSVDSTEDAPKQCVLDKEAVNYYHTWVKKKVKGINSMPDLKERELQAGIFGKIKEYSLRFAAILHLVDKTYESLDRPFTLYLNKESISVEVMERAIRAVEYFHKSAERSYSHVQKKTFVPQDDVRLKIFFNKIGRNYFYKDMAKDFFETKGEPTEWQRKEISRLVKISQKKYPNFWGLKEL